MSPTASVRIGVPAEVAWERWADLQSAPLFVERLIAVEPIDEVRAQWIDASCRAWETSLVEAVPHERISWTGEGSTWLVTICADGASRCVVTLTVSGPAGAQPPVVLPPRPSDLERFRVFVEGWVDAGEGWERAAAPSPDSASA